MSVQLPPLSGCGLLDILVLQTAKFTCIYICCGSTTFSAHMHKMMTLYDYSRLHNQGSSHNRVSKIQFLHHPPLTHTTTGNDFALLLSTYLLLVTPFLGAVLGLPAAFPAFTSGPKQTGAAASANPNRGWICGHALQASNGGFYSSSWPTHPSENGKLLCWSFFLSPKSHIHLESVLITGLALG